ncbi:MAG TPA: hypothetical protein VLL72_07540, partial [Kiloniellales bacterium]|nr:hypothetical protein [Kiloniellales bacterium]
NPLQIASVAVRLAVTAFIVPFAFIYGDGLLLQGDPAGILRNCATALAGVALMAVAVEGYLRGRLEPLPRIALGGAGLALIAPSLYGLALALALVVAAVAASAGLRGQIGPLLRASGRSRTGPE